MSNYQSHGHVTEIQVLSLLPDSPVSQDVALEPPTARETFESSLKAMNDHPDCIGVYFMRQYEDPQKIVMISSKQTTLLEYAIFY